MPIVEVLEVEVLLLVPPMEREEPTGVVPRPLSDRDEANGFIVVVEVELLLLLLLIDLFEPPPKPPPPSPLALPLTPAPAPPVIMLIRDLNPFRRRPLKLIIV